MIGLRRAAGQATLELVGCCIAVVLGVAVVRHGVVGSLPTSSPRATAQAPVTADSLPSDIGLSGDRSVVAIATTLLQLGIHEQGPDRGLWVDAFTAAHPEPWCADFVSWVWRRAGTPFVGGVDGWRIASAPALQSWFEERGRFVARLGAVPAPGDVVSFWHQHVGIVVAASPDVLETIEGNSSDAVSRRFYHGWRRNPDIAGFGHADPLALADGNFPGPAIV